jgi:hypothetical protein
MISYLIKSGLCLAILLAFYHLVLEREKMHQFNRFYLLGSVLISFLVPFVIIYVDPSPVILYTSAEVMIPSSQETLILDQSVLTESTSISWSQWLLCAYILISSLFAIRFFRNLLGLLIKIKTNEIIRYANAKLVLVEDTILPHTFWNYIFINKEEFQNKKVEKELFTHELTHVTQRHTLDVLIVESLHIALWFNPFFYPLKKAIQLNHEFLADDKVIASHQDIPKYQYLLLDKAAWKNDYYLASNLNYSLTKKRLLMMKTQNSKSTILWKKLAIIPLMGGLIFLFADRVEAQTTKKKPVVKEIQEESSATRAQMAEYNKILKEVKKTQMVKFKDLNRARYIYGLMSLKQQNDVQDIDYVIPPPPPVKVVNGVIVNGKKKKKKLPPPPPKQVKKIKEVKVKKASKEKKPEKSGWDLLEAQMNDPSLIVENKDIDKDEEIGFSWDNFEERSANIGKYRKQKKVEEIIEQKELKEEKEVLVEELAIQKKEKLEEKEILIEEAEIIEERELPEGLEEEEIEISNFKIIVEKEGNKISLKCKKGCAWKNLDFDLKKNGVQAINKYGMTSMSKKSDSDFLFLMTNKDKKLSLQSLKGTAWKGLEFSINKDEKRQINQYGVQRF